MINYIKFSLKFHIKAAIFKFFGSRPFILKDRFFQNIARDCKPGNPQLVVPLRDIDTYENEYTIATGKPLWSIS